MTVEAISPTGQVIDTIDAGSLDAGRHFFERDASDYTGGSAPTYRIKAFNGVLGATPMMRDKVISVALENGALALELAVVGKVAYGDITAIL